MKINEYKNKIIAGDAKEILHRFPDESIDCVLTSPPYWALRDYCIAGQIGLEPDFRDYIKKLCEVFDEAKRVLKPAGTCWVNIGETYGTGSGSGIRKGMQATNRGTQYNKGWQEYGKAGVPGMEKSLLQIPARFAIAMTDRGWILRNTIIWHKPNAMPQSVKDRFTMDFEYLFFFTKTPRYFFEQQLDPYTEPLNRWGGPKTKAGERVKGDQYAVQEREDREHRPNPKGRNKRSVWTISTRPCQEAHFATFPEELAKTPIKAGCPEFICSVCGQPRVKLFKKILIGRDESNTKYDTKNSAAGRLAQKRQAYRAMGLENPPAPEFIGYSNCGCDAEFIPGIVLDPFIGSGTTAVVARNLDRNFIGIELNPEYVAIAERRIAEIPQTLFNRQPNAGKFRKTPP